MAPFKTGFSGEQRAVKSDNLRPSACIVFSIFLCTLRYPSRQYTISLCSVPRRRAQLPHPSWEIKAAQTLCALLTCKYKPPQQKIRSARAACLVNVRSCLSRHLILLAMTLRALLTCGYKPPQQKIQSACAACLVNVRSCLSRHWILLAMTLHALLTCELTTPAVNTISLCSTPCRRARLPKQDVRLALHIAPQTLQ